VPAYREYVSDPANPVPYRRRPISPLIPRVTGGPGGPRSAVRRSAARRPHLREHTLEHDLTITGEVAADLFASTPAAMPTLW